MDAILTHAHALVYALLSIMPTAAQRDRLPVFLGLFLQADGLPLPEYSKIKSPGALSRFLNQYQWSAHGVIRAIRQAILDQLLNYQPRGRRPWLQVIIDLTTLEKCGKFKAFGQAANSKPLGGLHAGWQWVLQALPAQTTNPDTQN